MRRLVAMAALSAGACSPGGVSGAADGGQSACTFNCLEAGGFDGPVALEVRAELSGTCGQLDGCHGMGAGFLVITRGDEFAQLIGVASYEMPAMLRVLPGDPLRSYVYWKLRCEGGIQGACMPGGHPDPHTLQIFHDWIEAGAATQ